METEDKDTTPLKPVKQKKSRPGAVGRPNKTIPNETNAVIVAMLLSGHFTRDQEIADACGVSRNHVRKIKNLIPHQYLTQMNQIKKDRIAELVQANLEAMLESNIRIAELTKDEIWLGKQTAAEIATLLGVQSDKIFRILQAIEAATEDTHVGGDEE